MHNLNGVYTALITPFNNQGQLDEEGLRHLIRLQIKAGINGIAPIGSTGEAPTLSKGETKRIITIAREETPQHTCLMVGTGTYSTSQAIENTLQAQELGADMALLVVPYYNKPTQEGLYQHFKAIAEAASIPLVLYNNPTRTGQNIETETLKRLMEIPSIIGIKEASGNISQISETIEIVRERRPEFRVVSGDDGLTLPLMVLGGNGVISVLSNLLPQEVKILVEAAASKNFELAKEKHFELMPLIHAIFLETNPIPIKAALAFSGLPAGNCRLPLYPMSQKNAVKLQQALEKKILFSIK